MVEEADAAALVADVLLALARRGHDVRVTHVNGPRLVRLGALMLAEFSAGAGRETTEENDGHLD
jgi:carbamate kinase